MLRPAERRKKILSDIDAYDDNLVPQLSEKYGVSEMTIRRDLKVLEDDGQIMRTLGGAVRWPPAASEPSVLARKKRETLHAPQKAAIAAYAARELVADGEIIILEGGTTVAAMIPELVYCEDLTVVTNGLHTTNALQRSMPASTTILCAGGILRPESSTFVGPVTERFFHEYHANRLFLSATGLTLQTGVTDPKMLETQVKRSMIDSASEVIMLLDSSKFGLKSLMTVLDLDQVRLLITDEGAPAEMVQALQARDVDVVVVPVPEAEPNGAG